MRRARSSQRFRERSGFQCASDRPGCSAAVCAASEIGMRRRSPRCWAGCADWQAFVHCAGVFWRAAIARKRIRGKFLSSCWP